MPLDNPELYNMIMGEILVVEMKVLTYYKSLAFI